MDTSNLLAVQITDARRFSHFPHLLSHIKLAAHSNAKPLPPDPAQGSQWPAVIFSHGLAGNRTTYSHICSSMASHGLVVAAPEHRDGSCPVTYLSPTTTTPAGPCKKLYTKISHTPSNAVYRARDEQLRVRTWELGLLIEALAKIDDGSASGNLRSPKETPTDAVSWFRGLIDIRTPGKVTFAGHSFGAATTLQLVKTVYWSARSHPQLPISPVTPTSITDNKREQTTLFQPSAGAAISAIITATTPTILLDMWTLPLRSPFTSDLAALPMPHFAPDNSNGGAPILAVMSSAFAAWKDNFEGLKSVLADPYEHIPYSAPLKHPALAALLLQNDAASATDSGYESETASAQSVPAPSVEPPIVRPRAKAHIFYPLRSAHLSQSDYGVLFPTLTRYVAKGADPNRTIRLNVRATMEILRRSGIPVQGVKGKGNEDPTILSSQKDTPRGWVCVDVEDKIQAPDTAKTGGDSVVDKVVDQVAPKELQDVAEYGGKT